MPEHSAVAAAQGKRAPSVSSDQPYGSSSVVSKAVPISELPFFEWKWELSDQLGHSDELKAYSLKDVVKALGLNYSNILEEIKKENHSQKPHVVSDHVACKCMEEICNSIDPNFEIRINREIGLLSQMSAMNASTHQRPDGVAINKFKHSIALLYDVQSSPMRYTEEKAIMGAANFIRFMRNVHPSFSNIVVFALPNTYDKSCIVKIAVEWTFPFFNYTLNCYEKVQEGVQEIKRVFTEYSKLSLMLPRNIEPYFIRLSESDIDKIWPDSTDATQMASTRHIVVKCNTAIRKVLYDKMEIYSISLCNKLQGHIHHVIAPTWLDLVVSPHVRVYEYPKVTHGQLTREQAHSCLREFVFTLNQALQELHGMGFSHNDLRLPNVCFNDQYEAVLIDLDRCYTISKPHPYFSGAVQSCMYRKPLLANVRMDIIGKYTDYVQLGWLVAWIVSVHDGDNSNEHDRKWNDQPNSIISNAFISKLVQEGTYDSTLIETCIVADTATIQACINGDVAV